MALFAIRRGDFVVVFVESEQQPKREVTRLRLASVVPRVRVLAASRASIQRRGKLVLLRRGPSRLSSENVAVWRLGFCWFDFCLQQVAVASYYK